MELWVVVARWGMVAFLGVALWGNFLSLYSQFYEVIIFGGTYATNEGKEMQSVFLNVKLRF
jgi:hypothetical protein